MTYPDYCGMSLLEEIASGVKELCVGCMKACHPSIMAIDHQCKRCYNKKILEYVELPSITANDVYDWYEDEGLPVTSDLKEIGPLIKAKGRIYSYAVRGKLPPKRDGVDPADEISKMRIPGHDQDNYTNILNYCPDIKDPKQSVTFVYPYE